MCRNHLMFLFAKVISKCDALAAKKKKKNKPTSKKKKPITKQICSCSEELNCLQGEVCISISSHWEEIASNQSFYKLWTHNELWNPWHVDTYAIHIYAFSLDQKTSQLKIHTNDTVSKSAVSGLSSSKPTMTFHHSLQIRGFSHHHTFSLN